MFNIIPLDYLHRFLFFLTHWYVWMITENRSMWTNVHPLGYIYINRSLAYSQVFR